MISFRVSLWLNPHEATQSRETEGGDKYGDEQVGLIFAQLTKYT